MSVASGLFSIVCKSKTLGTVKFDLLGKIMNAMIVLVVRSPRSCLLSCENVQKTLTLESVTIDFVGNITYGITCKTSRLCFAGHF